MCHAIGPERTGYWHERKCVCFQAYATVVSAAEGNDPDSDNFGKVEEVKQYPSVTSLTSLFSRRALFHNFNTCFLCCDEFLEIDNRQVSWQMRCLEWRLYVKDLNFDPSTIHSWRNVVPQLVLQRPFYPSCVRARVSGLHQVHQAEDWPRGSTHLGGLLTQQSQPNTHLNICCLPTLKLRNLTWIYILSCIIPSNKICLSSVW